MPQECPTGRGCRQPTPVPIGRRVIPYDCGMASKRVLLAAPRGYCAGVDRAVQAVEAALDHYGSPVYVRRQIVHNLHVVRALQDRGAIFVEEIEEVPEGATVVFSAHGVAPTVHAEAAERSCARSMPPARW